MDKKTKAGTLLLTTSLLGVTSQVITSNLASAISIKEVLGDSTTTKKSKPSLFWQVVKGLGKGVAAAIGGALVGGTLAIETIEGLEYLTDEIDGQAETKFFLSMCSIGLGTGILRSIMNLNSSSIKGPIKNISTDELKELKLKIESVAKEISSDSKLKVYALSTYDGLEIGIKTEGDELSSYYNPTLEINISSDTPKVTFRENGVDSEKEEIKTYDELAQKLGNILHKVDKGVWACLDPRPDNRLSDIKIVEDVDPFVKGHPLEEILSFLEKYPEVLKGTTGSYDWFGEFIRLSSERDVTESMMYNMPIMSYKLRDDTGTDTLGAYSERNVINIVNSFLASKNLKNGYRLKIREDNGGKYKLALYKGEPSEDTYVGDIEDEEDVKILKDLEVPKAKRYIAYNREDKSVEEILWAYTEKYPRNEKMRDVCEKFYYSHKKLFLDETSREDSDGKPESRLYYISDSGARKYVFEPEDIKDDKDAQRIRKTIINIINRKYKK